MLGGVGEKTGGGLEEGLYNYKAFNNNNLCTIIRYKKGVD